MTYKDIWTQLNDIHTELIGDITPEQLESAWAEGQANPCGCSICQLMEAVTIAELRPELYPEPVEGPVEGIGETATKATGGSSPRPELGTKATEAHSKSIAAREAAQDGH